MNRPLKPRDPCHRRAWLERRSIGVVRGQAPHALVVAEPLDLVLLVGPFSWNLYEHNAVLYSLGRLPAGVAHHSPVTVADRLGTTVHRAAGHANRKDFIRLCAVDG